jgi:light-regulated signal transduction histidine kinase (bacteriophytochrome)/CheY-like chemotaxis protein
MVMTSARQKALLAQCASEPIHRLGRVQGFGMLLAFEAHTRRLSFASANAQAWTGRHAAELLGQPAETVLSRRNVEAAIAHADLARARGTVQHLHHVGWPGRSDAVDVTIHASGPHVVLEAEAAGPGPDTAMPAVGACTQELASLTTVADLARSAVRAVADVTGYSRVMLYRFAADGSGTVIAEQLSHRQPSYLGLRYPASDIPAQARELYLRNLSRVIADVHDEGWPLLALDGGDLDLSLSALRSVSPVHLQYLRNMGTAASMSVSLVIDGRLWGLIACHHHAPMRPPMGCRSMAELLGRLYSLAFARAERNGLDRDMKSLLLGPPGVEPLVDPGASRTDFEAACERIARLVDVSAIVTHFEGQTRSWGGSVTPAQAAQLAKVPGLRSGVRVQAVESLAALQPGLRRLAPDIAGMLALPLGALGRDWVMLLRDEVRGHVTWAGDPGRTVSRQRGHLCPRESFESWREAVRWHCEPWTAADIDLAEALRMRLLDGVLSRREHRELETTRRSAHQQALLVRELNHRVRNMLGLIKGLVQQTARRAASVDDLAERLHDRVHALSRAYTRIERAHWQPTALLSLMAEETGAFAEPGQVRLLGEAVSLEPNAYLSFALVIHEMATNARKYGALSGAAGRLDVTWCVDAGGALVIDWAESGVPGLQPPRHRGFGTRVIAQALQHALGGVARLDFQPDGLRARLQVQRGFSAGASTQAPAPVPVAARARPATLTPNRVLVVEDDPVIAILAEESLRQLGVKQVDVAGTREEALALLAARQFDLAMLDVNLGDHTSEAVAERLAVLQVPMIVATGYSEDDALPDALRGRPHLCKPYGTADLQRVLGEVPRG